jgi:biopolymer transport protein ExbB/TolQ
MLAFIKEGGPFMIPLIFIMIGLVYLTTKKVIDLFIKKKDITSQDESGINAILFWGFISSLLGILGQLTGLYLALNEIAMASEISPQIILLGLKISFNTTILGLWILLISSIVWFVLKGRYKKMINLH